MTETSNYITAGLLLIQISLQINRYKYRQFYRLLTEGTFKLSTFHFSLVQSWYNLIVLTLNKLNIEI